MQKLCYFVITFLCRLCLVSSLQCTETQYINTQGRQNRCCNKCQPGYYLNRHCSGSFPTQCKPCDDKRYIETYNLEWGCNFCESCNKSNMMYKSPCNATHNSVCECKSGYTCAGQPCKECRPVPPSSRPTPTPFRTASTPDPLITVETTKDTLWLMAIVACLAIATAACVVVKKKTLLWITFKCGYLLAKPHKPVSPCSVDEEVTKPVQEAGNVAKIDIDP